MIAAMLAAIGLFALQLVVVFLAAGWTTRMVLWQL